MVYGEVSLEWPVLMEERSRYDLFKDSLKRFGHCIDYQYSKVYMERQTGLSGTAASAGVVKTYRTEKASGDESVSCALWTIHRKAIESLKVCVKIQSLTQPVPPNPGH